AGRTSRRPCAASTCTRSSPTRRVNGRAPLSPARISANARLDLPQPAAPRINTARAPTRTAEAWSVVTLERREAHHEVRAQYLGAVRSLGHADAILGANAPAMGFNDLARDGKSKPGVLAKALMRPVGIKALKDALDR